MLGPLKRRAPDHLIAHTLDELVPADHFYQHLDATLDLSFVRDWVRDLYADRGRPSPSRSEAPAPTRLVATAATLSERHAVLG